MVATTLARPDAGLGGAAAPHGPDQGRPAHGRSAKRALDVTAALVLLALAMPVLAVLVVVMWARCGYPVLFRQVRVTGRGRTAVILKLRTLGEHGDADTRWIVPEHRLTPLGHWLRRTHLDELPQLVNVLRGDMSLVGPRPERPYFAEQFAREIPRYGDRHRVRAGLTGWAQVHGLNGDTSIAERVRFDNDYIDHWSLRLDLVILARTAVLMARGLGRAALAAPGWPALRASHSPATPRPRGMTAPRPRKAAE
jgi:lipopolysaccharide/colanic/teichoic acid biosynthesis glycosyltransferase